MRLHAQFGRPPTCTCDQGQDRTQAGKTWSGKEGSLPQPETNYGRRSSPLSHVTGRPRGGRMLATQTPALFSIAAQARNRGRLPLARLPLALLPRPGHAFGESCCGYRQPGAIAHPSRPEMPYSHLPILRHYPKKMGRLNESQLVQTNLLPEFLRKIFH